MIDNKNKRPARNSDGSPRHTASRHNPISPNLPDDLAPAVSGRTALGALLAIIAVALIAAVALPNLAPSITQSLLGDKPKAFWYVSRSSAFAALALTWLAMMLGLLITNRLARVWPGGPTALDLHQYTSLLGLAFALFHALVLLGDKYINYSPFQLLVPFASVDYEPLWVGVGQVSLYALAIISFSFYARGAITQRGWRLIHFSSFAVFVGVLAHSLFSGSDTSAVAPRVLYWLAGASVSGLTAWRVAVSLRRVADAV